MTGVAGGTGVAKPDGGAGRAGGVTSGPVGVAAALERGVALNGAALGSTEGFVLGALALVDGEVAATAVGVMTTTAGGETSRVGTGVGAFEQAASSMQSAAKDTRAARRRAHRSICRTLRGLSIVTASLAGSD